MKQELKSKHSREIILQAALELFSSQGYRATSMKEITERAGISTGRMYHHYTSKLEIFTTLLEQYWERLKDPSLKLNKLSSHANFPDNAEEIVEAIQEVVEGNKNYLMLIYIDVIEFSGEHIRRFYSNMAENFRQVFGPNLEKQQRRFNETADPLFAVMMTFRFFFQYFLVEASFGVDDHFGASSKDVTAKFKEILLHGLLKRKNEEGP